MAADIAEALQELVNKLDEIAANREFKSIWSLGLIHGAEYRGPNWVDALAKARKALQSLEPQPDAVYKLGQATEAEAVRNRAADWPPDA